jgi:hypothetical protein
MAKSEIPAIHVWQADENLVCQRAGRREKDFASSIKNDEEPGSSDELCSSRIASNGSSIAHSSDWQRMSLLFQGAACTAVPSSSAFISRRF